LIVDNDIDATLHLDGFEVMESDDGRYVYDYLGELYRSSSGLAAYIRFFTFRYPATAEPERFARDMAALSVEPHLIMLAMDDAFGQALAERYDVTLFPPYSSVLSIADSHPDVLGHRQIADGMEPAVAEAKSRFCGGA
jgi:hypothetical protein